MWLPEEEQDDEKHGEDAKGHYTTPQGTARSEWRRDATKKRIDPEGVAPGSTITLQMDAANTAAFYDIDVVDLEAPPLPLTPGTAVLISTRRNVAGAWRRMCSRMRSCFVPGDRAAAARSAKTA